MSKRTNKDTLREIRLRTFAIEVVKGKTPQEAYRKAHGGKQYKSNVLTKKGLCDALTGLAWRDDAQIVRVSSAKFYTSKSPGIRISLGEIPRLFFRQQPDLNRTRI